MQKLNWAYYFYLFFGTLCTNSEKKRVVYGTAGVISRILNKGLSEHFIYSLKHPQLPVLLW